MGKYKDINHQEQLELFLNDILDNGKQISEFVGDSQKRSTAKKCLGHSSYFPCEYCFSRGVPTSIFAVTENVRQKNYTVQKQLIREKLQTDLPEEEKAELRKLEKTIDKRNTEEKRKRKTKITWPASTANGEPRTREAILDILENFDDLTPEERKGVNGRSPFFDIPDFDIVQDSPDEYLHSSCLGLVKKVVELTFSVGQARPRKTKRPLSKPAQFNKLMQDIKTHKESSRRARDLDFAVLKDAEFRNIAILYFPLVIDCIEEEHGERQLWLYMAYMIRSCVLPDEEYACIPNEVVEACLKKFYTLYEKLFGRLNCTYNTHVSSSHLTKIRTNGPLTSTSAFVFESFYGEMRNCFVPGTISPLKQIFQKILLKRILEPHCCEIPIHFSAKETCLENDTILYVWENNTHVIYKIKVVEEDHLICSKVKTNVCDFIDIETIRLDWSQVGVYEKRELTETEEEEQEDQEEEETVRIEKKNVSGKVIQVKNLLITCPNNVLREK